MRRLTRGEEELARSVFGDAIDYGTVRLVHEAPFAFAVTLGSVILFPSSAPQDFAQADLRIQAWLIHELTHVWQHQTGVNVLWRGITERQYGYGKLDKSRTLSSYKIEQQAAIVEDYYRMTHGMPNRHGTGLLQDYRSVIPFPPMGR